MLKKLISFILSIVLVSLMIFPCLATTINELNEIENDFDLSSILVMIKKEYSVFGKEYYPSDFDEDLIASVRVMNQINPGDDTSGYDLEYWQQTLSVTLKEPGEENVEKAITAAYTNPEVEVATRNYIYTVDYSAEIDETTNDLTNELNNVTNNSATTYSTSSEIGTYPNDSRLDEQGGLTYAKAQRAWTFATGDNSVKIGVLDSGIDTHVDVSYNLLLSKNFTDESGLGDNVGHGTHVAGIINANTNNLIGVAGVCWKASIVNLKVLKLGADGKGTGTIAWLVDAIYYAAENSIKLLNISLDSETATSYEENLLTSAIRAFNGIIVCSAGNIDKDGETVGDVGYPSRISNSKIISVASCDSLSNLASDSIFNKSYTDIITQGVNILSTINTASYTRLSGTSMAAPFVTGAIGLLLSINPDFTPAQLRLLIIGNADVKTITVGTEEYEVPFLNILKPVLMALGYFLGDVNMDGTVTASDARLVLRYAASLETYTDEQAVIADVNYDGEITAADAQKIQKYAAELIETL